jgi:2-amino-4-hydroxy-6-hydroxymethyldihydropteridine diphosphokinase
MGDGMRCGIAMGSNVGRRLDHLRRAVGLVLQKVPGAKLTAAASVYETGPVDCPDGSEKFYNTVIEIMCNAEPHELLRVLRGIEAEMGRPNDHAWHAPRTIDLDILYCDDAVVATEELTVPHPRIAQRGFVLVPLAEIRAGLTLPGHQENAGMLLGALPEHDRVARVVTSHWLPERAGA